MTADDGQLTTSIKNASEKIRSSFQKTFSDANKSSIKTRNTVNKASEDAAKSTSKHFKRSAADIKASFDMVIGTVRRLYSSSQEFISAYQTQIESEAKLESAMRNNTGASDEQIQSVKDLASQMQKLGVVGDEVQLAGAQKIATFTKEADSIKSIMPVMNDLIAQQYGYNASTEGAVNVATLLGKTMQGQTGALKRYGYSFTKAQEDILKYGTEAQKVAVITEVVGSKVNGVNSALANTPTGKMKQLSNDVGDLKETLGNMITNILAPIAGWLDKIVKKANDFFSSVNAQIKELLGVEQETVSGAGIADITDDAADASEAVDGVTDAVNTLKKTIAGFDQLNILSDDKKQDTTSETVSTSGNKGSSSTEVKPSNVKVSKEISDAFEKAKKAVDKLKDAFKNLWNSKGFQNLLDGFKTFIVESAPDAIDRVTNLVNIIKDLINLDWNGLLKHLKDYAGDLLALSGDAALAVSTALFGKDSDITKSVKNALDNYKSAYKEYGLEGGIASWLKDVAKTVLKKSDNTVATKFLATWWDNCYDVFVKSLKKDGLSGALKNMFKYALNTSAPMISMMITSWGNKLIDKINKVIDGVNWFLGTSFSNIPELKLNKKTIAILQSPETYFGTPNTGGGVPMWPNLPRLATGGLVHAPTLALVGDNRNAGIDPEVVAPLSKLQGMMGGADDDRVLTVLNLIVDLLSQQSSVYENNVYLDGEKIDSSLVKIKKRKSRRYGGAY